MRSGKKLQILLRVIHVAAKQKETPRVGIVEHIAGMVEINNTKRSESGSVKMVDIV